MMQAIIFDWGGVLCEDTAPGLISYFSQALGVTPAALNSAYIPFAAAFQKGQVSEHDLWERLCAALGVERPYNPSLWGTALRTIYVPRKEMLSLASHLRTRGYKVGLLSNAELAAVDLFYEEGYDTIFDAAVFSCAEGTRKPEQRIYEIALERLGVLPAEAVLIDDRVEFIQGAQATGMHAIHFATLEQVKSALASLAIPVEQDKKEVP